MPDAGGRTNGLDRLIRADLSSIDRPLLCIIIDTEEEFDWTAPFSRRNAFVTAISDLRHGHLIFRRYGLRPTYLVDYPVIADARAGEILGSWVETGEALVGAQLHSWVTPPFEEVVWPHNTFPCNLHEDLERRKLATLTERIHATLGVPPRVYKAGRYGVDIRREYILRELGYTVDTSVMPFRDYSGKGGGPDFFGYPDQPFWSGPRRDVLYVPALHSLVGPLRRLAAGTGLDRIVFSAASDRLHLSGLLARLRLLERIMLTPEGVSLTDMQRLTETLLRTGYTVFPLSLHSPSFTPSGTPYVRSKRDLDAFLHRIEAFLEFFLHRLDGRAIDPLALRGLLVTKSETADA